MVPFLKIYQFLSLFSFHAIIGDQEMLPLHPQTNSTEPDNPRTWSAASVVQVPATREKHGAILKCLAFHESYPARAIPVEARLDVRCKYRCNI